MILNTQLSGVKRNMRQEDERGSQFESDEGDEGDYLMDENEEDFIERQKQMNEY